MKIIKIGLLGCGTVGSGVYKLLEMNKEKYRHVLNQTELEIVAIVVQNLTKVREGIPQEILTVDPVRVLRDPDIDVIIEVMGGTTLAKDYITEALRNGKHVVTANKDLMATQGEELLDLANEMGKMILFEASVAGAIPIINTLKTSLVSNQITKLMGIINGTTNFMLTKMFEEGSSLSDVLREAQELGYAEADPTSDVDGLDAARKIAILASNAFHRRVVLDDVYVEGIRGIGVEDISYAKQFGSTIKLLGIAGMKADAIEVRVHPTLLPLSHPLANVNDVYNAIYLEGNAFGDLTMIGKGAGSLPTASAVVADLLTIIKDTGRSAVGYDNRSCYLDTPILGIADTLCHYYVRMVVLDKTGVLAKIADTFAKNLVSIDSVIQRKLDGDRAELVILTDKVMDRNLYKAREDIAALDVVLEIKSVIRSEKEN